jgi:murein DD-endopeptidase MepM/ murein hydrolase activator NlpD
MTYKVKPGDTLSKIASRNGLSLQQLLAANPQFKADPNKLKVGDILNLPNGAATSTGTATTTTTTTTTTATKTATATATAKGALGTAAAFVLGTLSAKFETGGRGPGTVSTGKGDKGGVSYGSYQMATNTGTAKRFVTQADFPWRDEFKNLKPGTPAFSAKWKLIAKNEPEKFQDAQHAFIKKTHFDPLCAKVLEQDALDVTLRSHALQDAVWSTAVQFGGNSPIIHRALAKVDATPMGPDFDRLLIIAIYAEKGRKRPDGNLAYFSGSSKGVQKGVANRFKDEAADALKMLAAGV